MRVREIEGEREIRIAHTCANFGFNATISFYRFDQDRAELIRIFQEKSPIMNFALLSVLIVYFISFSQSKGKQ